jgi:hypothetical protein
MILKGTNMAIFVTSQNDCRHILNITILITVQKLGLMEFLRLR